MSDFFKCETQREPPSLSDRGLLRTGTKSDIRVCLDAPKTRCEDALQSSVYILDMAAVLHMIPPTPATRVGAKYVFVLANTNTNTAYLYLYLKKSDSPYLYLYLKKSDSPYSYLYLYYKKSDSLYLYLYLKKVEVPYLYLYLKKNQNLCICI